MRFLSHPFRSPQKIPLEAAQLSRAIRRRSASPKQYSSSCEPLNARMSRFAAGSQVAHEWRAYKEVWGDPLLLFDSVSITDRPAAPFCDHQRHAARRKPKK
jgi:hypothetical protein